MLPMDFCNTYTRASGRRAPCSFGAGRAGRPGPKLPSRSRSRAAARAIARALANDPPILSPRADRQPRFQDGRLGLSDVREPGRPGKTILMYARSAWRSGSRARSSSRTARSSKIPGRGLPGSPKAARPATRQLDGDSARRHRHPRGAPPNTSTSSQTARWSHLRAPNGEEFVIARMGRPVVGRSSCCAGARASPRAVSMSRRRGAMLDRASLPR